MKENNITNHDDGSGKRDVVHPSRDRRLGIVRLGLLALMLIFALGVSECPSDRSPSIRCGITGFPFAMQLEPGECAVFVNPCEDYEWSRPGGSDGFRLEPSDEQRAVYNAEQVTVKNETSLAGETIRSICVGAGVPLHDQFPIGYRYSHDTDFGLGTLLLTVTHPLSLSVTAAPLTIDVGESSQLVANVSGGIPPYFYSWTPATNLDRSNVAAPIAMPPATETYTVTITDSGSQHMTGSVTVNVRPRLTVTANPDSIRPLDPSQLSAITQGGSPPYFFSWTPTDTLDNPLRVDPIARPATTTTYHVTVSDMAGAVLNGSVTVIVSGTERLHTHVTASPSSIHVGETTQLDVVVTGGVPPYTYFWSSVPSGVISDPHIRNPVASPAVTTTFGVSVRDQELTTFDVVTVTVETATPTPTPTPTPLTASFGFNRTCCPLQLNLDATASTGNIFSYTWDLSWTTASPDRVTTSPTTSFFIQEFNRGTVTLTVTDTNGITATTTRSYP